MNEMKIYEVVVIGAGLSGVCAAIKLKEAGVANFHVFEKGADVGGTWRDNRYPGVACDVPSHLYSYSFAPNPEWSRWYAPGAEIWDYVKKCATEFDVYDQITFNTLVESAVWETDRWVLTDSNGSTFAAKSIVSALGGLHTPNLPDIPGQDIFSGQQFHTTEWPDELDLTGKRVAVVGTGATAVQIVPEIADQVEELFVFQRSPVWVGSKKDPEYTEEERAEFRSNPEAVTKLRHDLYQSWESSSIDLHRVGTEVNTNAEMRARQQIQRSVSDPEVAKALTPDHNFTCKRATISNRYYATYDKDNVTLVTGAVDSLTQSGLVSDGESYDVDVIVFATGFKAFNIANEIDLTGAGGLKLTQAWKNRVTSFKTVMIHDFPNLFLMMGPNGTGLHSALQTIEAQGDYVVRMVEHLQREAIVSLNPKQEFVDEFTRDVERRFEGTTHDKGCTSWWSDQTGFNHSISPGSSDDYRSLIANIELDQFEVGG
ncbi:MAG: FAD-dependent oxidoreductase [Pseudomonadales bacterium]|nr:FAD-dependent oxidoreductase [Pseudomonadales bacterium]